MPPKAPATQPIYDDRESEPEGAHLPNARLGPEIQAKIGLQLRSLYNSIVDEGTPDRFVRLLDQLDKDKGTKGSQE